MMSQDRQPDCLLLSSSLGVGGAERALINLANAFARSGLSVELAVLTARGSYAGTVDPRVTIVELGSPRLRSSFIALVRHLRRSRPSSIVSKPDNLSVAVIAANWLAGSPSRVYPIIASYVSSAILNSESWIDRNLIFIGMRIFYPHATKVICLTRSMADDLAGLVKLADDQLTVIPNIVEIPKNNIDHGKIHPWLDDRSIPLIVSMGRLVPQKDFATLLRAFAILRASRDVRLLIFGEGPEREALRSLIKDLGIADSAEVAGFTDCPFHVYGCAKIFVLSSRWEGLPMVLLEALACGCQIVATDCPTGPAEILDGGRFGRLAPVGDPDALSHAMAAELDEPGNSQRQQARATEYSPAAVVHSYRQLIGI